MSDTKNALWWLLVGAIFWFGQKMFDLAWLSAEEHDWDVAFLFEASSLLAAYALAKAIPPRRVIVRADLEGAK